MTRTWDDILEPASADCGLMGGAAPVGGAAGQQPGPAAAVPPAGCGPAAPAAGAGAVARDDAAASGFLPAEPGSFRDASLNDSLVESLVLKYLLARGDATGRDAADQVKLPFILIDELLRSLKSEQLVTHRGSAPMNDFVYELTDLGRERARRFWNHCTYFGSAPVSLADYVQSVKVQSLTAQHPNPAMLRRAFADLVLNQRMLDRLGPAINSGRGLFLFGAPGNGKTSIAERVTRAFGPAIWIPPPSASTARSFASSTRRATKSCPWQTAAACTTSAASTNAGSASAGPRSSSAAS